MVQKLPHLGTDARARLLTKLGVRNVKGLGKTRARLGIPPRKLTPEEHLERSTRMKGIVNASKRVRCIETGQVFDSQREAAAHFGKSPSNLCDHLKGRRPTFADHTFEWVKLP